MEDAAAEGGVGEGRGVRRDGMGWGCVSSGMGGRQAGGGAGGVLALAPVCSGGGGVTTARVGAGWGRGCRPRKPAAAVGSAGVLRLGMRGNCRHPTAADNSRRRPHCCSPLRSVQLWSAGRRPRLRQRQTAPPVAGATTHPGALAMPNSPSQPLRPHHSPLRSIQLVGGGQPQALDGPVSKLHPQRQLLKRGQGTKERCLRLRSSRSVRASRAVAGWLRMNKLQRMMCRGGGGAEETMQRRWCRGGGAER